MSEGKRTVALIVAAGKGERAGGGVPKQYRRIAGRSVLVHAVRALLAHPGVDEVRVVIGAGQENAYHAAIGDLTLPSPVIGGETRRESVLRGLIALDGADQVLIHDAARPFLPGDVIDRLLAALDQHAGVVPVLPVADTLAHGGEILGDVVPRDGLVRVQTPQAFHYQPLLAAHRDWPMDREATDDAQIARVAGLDVAIVQGDPALEKITFGDDVMAAEAKFAAGLISRTGMGFDVHAFKDGAELWLGGIRIDHPRGLAGHSDADVALHAVTDALLGTIGDGDIGQHFPPSDPQWKGAASARFVEHARARVEAHAGIIDHVDLTIICEKPKIGDYREAIRANLAGLLQVEVGQISIKATTTERLGFTGRGEGIAAQAVATVRLPGNR